MEDLKIIKDMAKESLFGIMDKHIKANGMMESKMDQVFGNQEKEIAILVNGLKEKFKVKEYILQQLDKGMKVILKIFLNLALENRPFQMEINMKGYINMVTQMEKENIYGKIILCSLGSSNKDIELEKVK